MIMIVEIIMLNDENKKNNNNIIDCRYKRVGDGFIKSAKIQASD